MVELSRFTGRQRQILGCLARGLTIQECADELGISKQRVHQVCQMTKGRVADLMDDAGLTDAALVNRYLKPALEATETEFAKFQGTITDSREVIAWGPRLQALELAAKMRGTIGGDKAQVNVGLAVRIQHVGSEPEE